ncbi:hypothetical protein MM26B8_00150 [Mycoplasmopsis meleagridis]|nr:hypothetical protein [Mycoplasmopsis meleagridis]OAD18573.1 hypothetical protein MM26B8_00150 [Mycoplasmopsis meleagridis]
MQKMQIKNFLMYVIFVKMAFFAGIFSYNFINRVIKNIKNDKMVNKIIYC